MRTTGIALLLAFVSIARAADPTWPPEPKIELRALAAPTAFPSAGRTYVVYEVALTNLSKTALGMSRLEVRDADNKTAGPIAIFEGEQLDKILQHFGNPAIGDLMPEAVAGHRSLAAGEAALVFLTLVLEPDARVPDRLSHRLITGDSSVEGAIIGTRTHKLHVIGPPVDGYGWQAFSGAGDNNSHHRRQILVLGGHPALPNRLAIDWKRTENGASFSGAEGVNVSYYSYGKQVLAVANGTVVVIKDGIPDNSPGHVGAEALKLSLETIGGNLVVLDLGQGQFAQYMHLQPGSLRVRPGSACDGARSSRRWATAVRPSSRTFTLRSRHRRQPGRVKAFPMFLTSTKSWSMELRNGGVANCPSRGRGSISLRRSEGNQVA